MVQKLGARHLKFLQNDVEFAQQKDGLMKRRLGDEQTIQMIKGQEPGERTGDVCRRDGICPAPQLCAIFQ